jgi:hypothetical protein
MKGEMAGHEVSAHNLNFSFLKILTLILMPCVLSQAPYFWPSNCWEPENTDYGEN